MARGISLHIGLNRIDPSHYGTEGRLAGAENDATAMRRLAASLGYETSLLLTASARADAVFAAIREAAARLAAGDTFFITYAGHGAQIPDAGADEQDRADETWCAYDRMIVDDELYAMWGSFKPETLIVAIVDSCHSGTSHRVMRVTPAVSRGLPFIFATRVAYDTHRALYDSVKAKAASAVEASPIAAGGISLSAAKDEQLAADGLGNGLFTEKLLQAWDGGRFEGDYRTLVDAVRGLMPQPGDQTPGYETFGATSGLLSRQPFELAGPAEPCACPAEMAPTAPIVTPTKPEECTMQNIDPTRPFVDSGNWEQVAHALQQMPGQRGGGDFMSRVIAANARAAQEVSSGVRAPTNGEAALNRGGSVFRAYWWGFCVEVSHDDLNDALRATDPNGDIVKFLRQVIPQDYQYWIAILTPFVAVSAQTLRALDRGRGVYISMSWFAAGIFIPASI